MNLVNLCQLLLFLKTESRCSFRQLRLLALVNCDQSNLCEMFTLFQNPSPFERITAILYCSPDFMCELVELISPLNVFEQNIVILSTFFKLFAVQ